MEYHLIGTLFRTRRKKRAQSESSVMNIKKERKLPGQKRDKERRIEVALRRELIKIKRRGKILKNNGTKNVFFFSG